jgi:hypothetical protein
VRNEWAHQNQFTRDDTYRALDSIERLLVGIGASAEAREVGTERKKLILLMAQAIAQEGFQTQELTSQVSSNFSFALCAFPFQNSDFVGSTGSDV